MSETLTRNEVLSPAPILEAVERYRGTILDLDAGRALSADEFARSREQLTAGLARAGLAPGDRVVMAVANGPLFVATLTAILANDACPILLHAKTPPAEIRRYAERFKARFVAGEPEEESALAQVASRAVLLDFGGACALRFAPFDLPEPWLPSSPLLGVPLHPTSGSTGLPKIALRPGFAALEEARHYAETMSIDADDTIMAMPPMSHAYGYGMCVMVPLLTGASIVSMRKFSAKVLQRALTEQHVSILPTVPAMLDVLSFGRGTDLRQTRFVLTAGALLPGRTAESFRQKIGVTACPLYGTTETGGISVATAADGRDVDGRVGPPMNGVSVKTCTTEESADLGEGLGKLYVRSSSMMFGYLDDDDRVNTEVCAEWFGTGDLARIEDDGNIHLRGRDSEVINVSGLKVVPCEVEEAILQLPGVREVKVYAGEHRSGTQTVKVAVAVNNGLSGTEIRAHCEEHLVYYKRPQVVTIVDALPRTPTGKINRELLP